MKNKAKIHELFEKQVLLYPDKIAIKYHGLSLSYKQLNDQANQFARFLTQHDVRTGDLVPILAEKSIHLITIVLAVLKAGAVYVPINTDSSSTYIYSVLKETQAKMICTSSRFFNTLQNDSTKIVHIDEQITELASFSADNVGHIDSENAYVIYTSGTTGNPKGVIVKHENVVPTYFSWQTCYDLTPNDIHLQMASFGFDVFTGDWIRALCSGGTLILCPKDLLLNPKALYELILEEHINCAEFVPAVLRQLMNYVKKHNLNLDQFRLLVCGSDQWTMKEYRLAKQLSGASTRVISSYGLTETTIDSTYFEEKSSDQTLSDSEIVPIGKPFPHVKVYLLEENKIPVHVGEYGEIYIGGDGVASGYLNRKKMTDERFIYFNNIDSNLTRLYRTGDLAKLLPNENLAFLGRNQEDIKIDGKRVNLPSLEGVVNQHPKINYSVILPIYKDNSIVGLECYATLNDQSITFEELVSYLRQYVPSGSIPKRFYQIDHTPLTLNGKIDRKMISQEIKKEIKPSIVRETTFLERQLIQIWKEVLDTNEIGINNDFYDLGGTSLLYVSMLEKINERLGIDLPCGVHFKTISILSKHINENFPKYGNDRSKNENRIITNRGMVKLSIFSNSNIFNHCGLSINEKKESIFTKLDQINQKRHITQTCDFQKMQLIRSQVFHANRLAINQKFIAHHPLKTYNHYCLPTLFKPTLTNKSPLGFGKASSLLWRFIKAF